MLGRHVEVMSKAFNIINPALKYPVI
jgi:hypothetical protein